MAHGGIRLSSGDAEGHRHRLQTVCLRPFSTAARDEVSVTRAVDRDAGDDRPAAVLALHERAGNPGAVHDRIRTQRVEHRLDTGRCQQLVRDALHHLWLRVDHETVVKARAALRLGALDPLAADTGDAAAVWTQPGVEPGQREHHSGRPHPAEEAVTLEHDGTGTGARCPGRGGDTGGSAADHQHVDLRNDRDLPCGFCDLHRELF